MDVIQSFLTGNPCYKKNQTITPKGLMLHSVGTPQPNARVFTQSSWWNGSSATACVHGFIDGVTGIVYQTLPWTRRGWHCGSGSKGSANNTHIGVEMCEPDCIKYTSGCAFTCSDKVKAISIAVRTYNAAVELFAELCKQFNLDPLKDGVIISHREGHARGLASNHGDVEHLWNGLGLNYTMKCFREDVAEAMGAVGIIEPESSIIAADIAPTALDEYGWLKLKQAGVTDAGAAGTFGNLYAESKVRPNNLQNSFEAKLHMTDVQYTAAVDNKTYNNFIHDKAGYGIAQWTFWSLKEALKKYMDEHGVSIGDGQKQIDFLVYHLQTYKSLWQILITTTSVQEASDAVLTMYERPADQGTSVKKTRASYAQAYYNRFCESGQTESLPNPFIPANKVTPVNYLFRVTIDDLNIRRGPGTNYDKEGKYTGKGVFTIVNEAKGPGATLWGELKAGGWISLDFGEKVTPKPIQKFVPYTVRVTATDLNIRKGAGTNFDRTKYITPGVYTIVEEKEGPGSTLWGRLKSGEGWISLDYVTKVKAA